MDSIAPLSTTLIDSANDATGRRTACQSLYRLFAGTGPFAPLALLALPHLRHHRLRVTLLDVDASSAASVRTLVHRFNLSAQIDAILCADATTYTHPRPIHVVISETLQRSLSREPLAPILRNLRPQLAPGGLIVPERVPSSSRWSTPISSRRAGGAKQSRPTQHPSPHSSPSTHTANPRATIVGPPSSPSAPHPSPPHNGWPSTRASSPSATKSSRSTPPA